LESYIKDIIRSVSSTFGDEFFSAITLQLDKAIKSDYTFIARLDKEYHVSSTVALVANGQLVENIEYSLTNSPCKDVSDDSVCIYTKSVIEAFPQEQLLIDMKIEGYLGMPLHDSIGKVMGLVVGLYEKEISDEKLALTLFQLFSGRIAAEFDRLDKENQLKKLNSLLDSKVKERTHELELALNNLHSTQDKLVEIEKMAALGDLVSGVAHEVNTPLGICVTSISAMEETVEHLKKGLESQQLTKEQLTRDLELLSEYQNIIARSINKAVELIRSFKSVAVEQHSDIEVEINLAEHVHNVIRTVRTMFKGKNYTINLDIDENLRLVTFPSAWNQILTNFLMNSHFHGFEGRQDGTINIFFSAQNNNLILKYCDDGKGIDDTVKAKIFDPFVTTKRGQGGSGLGLNIVFNLINAKLGGVIKLLDQEQGCCFEVIVPIKKH